ncbi:MAG: DUF4383 domain-containing protein [Thermoleophilaceae bacterium]
MQNRSPAQLYALIFGVVLVVAGIIGFFYSSDFGSPGKVDGVLGILDVNAWHNIVHIATGLLGLAAAGSYLYSRNYAFGLGAVYVVIAIWGFIIGDGDSILGFIPVNTEDNFLHLLIGVAGIGAGAATPAEPAPTTTTPTAAA